MEGGLALEAVEVSRRFGGVDALRDVSLQVAEGERRLILGPNGAGKSVFFSVLGGQLPPSSGQVRLLGRDVTRLSPHKRAKLGLARTFQLNSLFPELTVRENIALAVQAVEGIRWSWRSAARHPRIRSRVDDLLGQWRLEARAERVVSLLSYGERRRLEIILSMVGEPKVLLLDEPTAGLTAEESSDVLAHVDELPRDMAVVMIEHDMAIADRFAERITVLALGSVIADGPADEVRQDVTVRRLYLGEPV